MDKIMEPTISIIIPQLGREAGLKRCLESIEKLAYPQDRIEVIIVEGPDTVPVKVASGLARAKGEYIAYLANDTTIEPNAIYLAVEASKRHKKGLVSFNTGPVLPDRGNANTHFIITRELIDRIGGQIFSTRMRHLGVDNLLMAQCEKINEWMWCEEAIVHHHHFSTDGKWDEVYARVWNNESAASDRAILVEELAKLNDTSGNM